MRNASRRRLRHRGVFAFCIWHLAFAAACARTPPATPAAGATSATHIAATDPLQQLQQSLTAATRAPGVQRGVWGVIVHSLDRNERLFELSPQTLLVPASVAKLAAVATAADAVGWDYRYETTVRATGPIVDGVLRGDLIVVGSGDPTTGGRAGDDIAAWVDALKAAGLRKVDGRVIGDDDAIEEPRPQLAWAWDDLGYTTGSLFGALNLAENRLTVTITPGGAAGAPAALSVEPHASYRPLSNRVVTAAAGNPALVWPEQRPAEPFLTIAGTVVAGTPPTSLNVSAGNPTFWFASVFRNRLLRHGIDVTGEAWDVDDIVPPLARTGASVLFTHRSRPLSDIVQPLLKDSINLYAEAVMRLNSAPGTFPTNDAALEAFRRRLQNWGIAADAQQVIDGSGLSRRDVMTAEAVMAILQRMQDPTAASPFVRALPVAGVDGSLANRMRDTPAAGNVRAKTGTMSNIRSLAGYATTRDGERLAFVAMVNNFEGAGAAANQALDAIAVALATFSRTAP
jgi:D-alanyl-D-alanine carboxypeptidase/D-alanyl-D-alanine-endopeptidase (penicillin-binding protein 4)